MNRLARSSAARAQPWDPEGVEAAVVLDLARQAVPRRELGQEHGEEWFLAALSQHVRVREHRQKGSGRRLAGYALLLACAVGVEAGYFAWHARADRDREGYDSVSVSRPPLRSLVATDTPLDVSFTDGTSVTLERQTFAGVFENMPKNTRLRLDSGRMVINVAAPGRAACEVAAGPFVLRASDAAFTLEWFDAQRYLQVEVARGRLVVDGAGQRRELSAGDSYRHTEPLTATPDEDAGEAWSLLVAAGEPGVVVDAARERGLDNCLEGCSRDELHALAQAARASGEGGLARLAASAERARFGSSPAASSTASSPGAISATCSTCSPTGPPAYFEQGRRGVGPLRFAPAPALSR